MDGDVERSGPSDEDQINYQLNSFFFLGQPARAVGDLAGVLQTSSFLDEISCFFFENVP